jgi:hypothetical protein
MVGDAACNLVSVTGTQVVCTTPAHEAGDVAVVVTCNGQTYPELPFVYDDDSTPEITETNPLSGLHDEDLTISGKWS